MHADLVNGLRWVLMSDEQGWRDELSRVLAPWAAQPDVMQEVRELLVSRLPDAAASHRPRMEAMIGAVADLVRAQAGLGDAAWDELARTWDAADRRVEALERELATARRSLMAAENAIRDRLAPREVRTMAAIRFERRPDQDRVRVIDPERIPRELLRLVPDEERMQRRWSTEGVVTPGTLVVAEPGGLDVWRVG